MPEKLYRLTSWFDTFNKRLPIGVLAGAGAGLILITLFFPSFTINLLRYLQQPERLRGAIIYFGLSLINYNVRYITILALFFGSLIASAYLLCNPLGFLRDEITKNILFPAFCFMIVFLGVVRFTLLHLTLLCAVVVLIISVCLAMVLSCTLRGYARFVYYDLLIGATLIAGILSFCSYL